MGASRLSGTTCPEWPETAILDAGGRFVTPGLIDLHTHLFDGISQLGVSADATCLPAGVTTAVDAGTAGEIAFARFAADWLRPSATRTYAFVNLRRSACRWTTAWSSAIRHAALRRRRPRIVEVIETQPRRLPRDQDPRRDEPDARHGAMRRSGSPSTQPSATAAAAHGAHHGARASPLDDVFDLLRPGDIVTHLFHGRGQTVVGDDGHVLAGLRARP